MQHGRDSVLRYKGHGRPQERILRTTIMDKDYENMTLIEAILLGCKRGLINFAPIGVLYKWFVKRGTQR
jgi:hypothetical protein